MTSSRTLPPLLSPIIATLNPFWYGAPHIHLVPRLKHKLYRSRTWAVPGSIYHCGLLLPSSALRQLYMEANTFSKEYGSNNSRGADPLGISGALCKGRGGIPPFQKLGFVTDAHTEGKNWQNHREESTGYNNMRSRQRTRRIV